MRKYGYVKNLRQNIYHTHGDGGLRRFAPTPLHKQIDLAVLNVKTNVDRFSDEVA
ncbi:hypothetical protein [Algibacillus agarilyticus]|uniref:hypothetical protein n=1 Tax=Algibacillus agarilyticus TaxID=2234133 RepID=UPI00130087EA|nr:hypothetical protein [Algibacillus agarilyticus]